MVFGVNYCYASAKLQLTDSDSCIHHHKCTRVSSGSHALHVTSNNDDKNFFAHTYRLSGTCLCSLQLLGCACIAAIPFAKSFVHVWQATHNRCSGNSCNCYWTLWRTNHYLTVLAGGLVLIHIIYKKNKQKNTDFQKFCRLSVFSHSGSHMRSCILGTVCEQIGI